MTVPNLTEPERAAAADLTAPAHRLVFEAMSELADEGQPVDGVTVAEELRRRGQLDQAGGPGYLLDLQAATPSISNAARYAAIVIEDARKRRLRLAGPTTEFGCAEEER